MVRRPNLRPLRPILSLALATIVLASPAARAQERGIADRLDRLERELGMLQRQIYHGGSGGAVETELRMDRLETQMRELTGRLEDAVNGVEQLRRRLEQINNDIELRFSQGQALPKSAHPNEHASAGVTDSGPGSQLAMRGAAPVGSGRSPRPPADVMPPGTVVPPPPDRPSGPGTLTPPGVTLGGSDSVAGNFRPPSAGALPPRSASDQYNAAFGLLKKADYSAAEGALKEFMAKYPNDALAGSAQYWLGETYYARARYPEAASAFAEGYKKYPKGVKAADDLLKLGMALARANQKQNACVAFAQLDHDFPHPGNAIKETAVAEKKRLGC